MSTQLLPDKARRLLIIAKFAIPALLFLVFIDMAARRFPIASPVTLPLASMVTLAMSGALGVFLWHVRKNPTPPWLMASLPESVPAERWEPQPGSVLIGVTDESPHTETHGVYPFAVWDKDPHLLLAGSTGAGKTSAVRFLAYSLLLSGYRLAVFDGKGSGALAAALDGRERIMGVAHTPGEWTELIGVVKAEMDAWFEANLAYESGKRTTPPEPLGIACIIDELVDICEVAKRGFVEPLSAIARMGRESGIRIAASVLRPDVAESLPGLVKAQLRARVALGKPTLITGQMLFEDDYKKAADVADSNAGDIQGRGVAVLGGKAYRIQLPWVPPASQDSSWLPPRRGRVNPADGAAERAVALRNQGASFRAIAQTLTDEGYPTRSGGPWTPASAQRLVKRPSR